ncbi:MAG: response regulator transcription factor [Anaerolineales bacterium]|nr:response regulator transcription factor [Anaerolineales bacterium]
MNQEKDPQLTVHQIRVLRLVANGLTNKEIADFLKVRERTVEYHLSQIFQRLEVSSRATAILKAERLGLLNKIYRR